MNDFNLEISDDNSVTVSRVVQFASPQTEATLFSATQDKFGTIIPAYSAKLGSTGLVLTRKTFRAHSAYTFLMTLNYTKPQNVIVSGTNWTNPEKPWDEPPQIACIPDTSIVQVTDRYYTADDLPGNPTGIIRLPTGRPFDNPPVVPVGAERISINWKSKRQIPASVRRRVRFSVNSAAVTIDEEDRLAETLYMETITSIPQIQDDVIFYQNNCEILYNPEGHAFRPLLMDYKAIFDGKLADIALDEENGVYIKYESGGTGSKVDKPVLLNTAGGLLTTNPLDTVTQPVFGYFPYRPAADWTDVDLPGVKAVAKRR